MAASDNCKEEKCLKAKCFESFPKDSDFIGKFCTAMVHNGEKLTPCMKVIEWDFKDEKLKPKPKRKSKKKKDE